MICTVRRSSHSLALGHPCVGDFINTALSKVAEYAAEGAP
jgi:hypothetical protein